jgi:putative transcriptional regulator
MKSHVKKFRTNKGLTQEELALQVQTSRQSIYAIEIGKFNPSMVLALKIASVLDVTLYELFELEAKDWLA